MVFYFTGTGNSLYAAKQLDTELISIPQIIRGDELAFSADSIGIVCPIYGHEIPSMVKQFIQRSVFKLNIPEKNPQARYRNVHISLREIVSANNQLVTY